METFEIRDRRGGFLWVSNQVFDYFAKQVNSTTFMIYMALCRMANNETQDCYPSQAYIAGMIGVDERTVRRCMDELINMKLVGIEKKGRAYSYTLLKTPDNLSAIDTGHGCPTIPDISNKNTGHQCPPNKTNNKTQEQDLILLPPSEVLADSKSTKKSKIPDPRHQPFKKLLEAIWVHMNPELPPANWDAGDAGQLGRFLTRWKTLDMETFKCWLQGYYESKNTNRAHRPKQFLPRLHDFAYGPRGKYNELEETRATV